MFFVRVLALSGLAALVAGSPSYPSGPATIWEMINCVRNSDGYQTQEMWKWDQNNPPSDYNSPNYKTTVVSGGPYYWEAKHTSWKDSDGFEHVAYIMDGVSPNQGPNPLGISLNYVIGENLPRGRLITSLN